MQEHVAVLPQTVKVKLTGSVLCAAASTLNTMQVKQLCRRQLLAKTSTTLNKSQRTCSPSCTASEQVRQPAVETLRPADTVSAVVTWHMPVASCDNDMQVHRSAEVTRSSDGTTVVSFTSCLS